MMRMMETVQGENVKAAVVVVVVVVVAVMMRRVREAVRPSFLSAVVALIPHLQ
jgi:hypothetical protein